MTIDGFKALPTPVQFYERLEVLLLCLGEFHELRPHPQLLVRGFSTVFHLDLELNGQDDATPLDLSCGGIGKLKSGAGR